MCIVLMCVYYMYSILLMYAYVYYTFQCIVYKLLMFILSMCVYRIVETCQWCGKKTLKNTRPTARPSKLQHVRLLCLMYSVAYDIHVP